MGVVQVNVWTCDLCGAVETTIEKTSLYDDPVVYPPDKWRESIGAIDLVVDGKFYDTVCPECREKHTKEGDKK